MEILQFRGRTAPYLEPTPGQPQHHLLRMAKKGLVADLGVAIAQARESGSIVLPPQRPIEADGSQGHVRSRRDSRRSASRLARSTSSRWCSNPFDRIRIPEPPARIAATKPAPSSTPSSRPRRRTCKRVLDRQQGVNDDLLSANQDLVSGNEELQSLNEELGTAKEELQSTNEELSTLNEELHNRNDELDSVNGDLLNILASVEGPDRDRRRRTVHPPIHAQGAADPQSDSRPTSGVRSTTSARTSPSRASTGRSPRSSRAR
jgi:two-component system CheB/CheR fusion protein